ncbi:MAG: sulfatase [Anaerolineae bacterium]|nr:sulfatase [Anaerolineae bacterium]
MSKPDIVFIVLDTQRADRLGTYGHQKAHTPNLDKFADQAALFEQAISPAQWTIPSHASLFSGLYPTAHQVTQSSQSLSPDIPHLAEVLTQNGYDTVGFCNNPLVGVLNNGFKRGFKTFYNYGGAFPSLPKSASRFPAPIAKATEAYTQFLRKISYPVQNFFGQSDLAFRLSLNSWTTPLWSRFANFKGQNARSTRDVSRFLQDREQQETEKPLFLFLNLMETHLPFWPPGEFIDKTAPYFRKSKEARDILQTWNREAYRWAAPLAEPLGDLESQVLSDLYDAEVAYQDDYLGGLFEVLNGRSRHQNTLTIIVSDHGDGLGEHNYMGHAFVAYQELVHVPLMLQWPERLQAARIATPVSTRRVYHTILDAAGHLPDMPNLDPATVHGLTLTHTINGRDPENGAAYSEIYPPLNFVRAIENRQPQLLEPFGCLSERRAVVKASAAEPFKLIHVNNKADELFNLKTDPLESANELANQPQLAKSLHEEIKRMTTQVTHQRDHLNVGDEVELDDTLLQQLRGLGYMD